MNPSIKYQEKMDKTVETVLDEFGDAVVGIFSIGSITREATPTSDLDIVVVFEDHNYNKLLDEIRGRFSAIADELNIQIPRPELALWPSKVDNYRTMYPDVSYVRNNLPDRVTRLDAWCGLAKHILINYECASAKRLYGDTDLKPTMQRIPLSECVELFLISTRALAEGVVELASEDPTVARRGINHVAKAGLRAVYSVLIRKDEKPRNSYSEIYEAAKTILPDRFVVILETLYKAKIGQNGGTIDLQQVFELFRYCESQIAEVRRQQLTGLAYGRAGEGFGFLPDQFDNTLGPIEEYSRFPLFSENYIHALYFLMSAYEIANRFTGVASDLHPDVLEFYCEELTTLGTFAQFNPTGMRLVVGREERAPVELKLGYEFLKSIASLLATLAEHYLGTEDNRYSRPWLSTREKLLRIHAILMTVSAIPGIEVPKSVMERLNNQIDDAEAIEVIAEWQSELVSGMYSLGAIETFGTIGLTLIQSGRIELAQKVLKRMVSVEHIKTAAAGESPAKVVVKIDQELSKVHQYLGITYHHQEKINEAKEEYEKALNLDPNNYSAIDDYANMLVTYDPSLETVQRLRDVVSKATREQDNAKRQVANRLQNRAIDFKQQGDFESAKEWYSYAIEVDPTFEKTYHNLGVLHHDLGNYEEAMKLYKKAIELNPDYRPPYIGLGIVLERGRRFEEVVELLSEAVRREIANEHLWTNLGNSYLLLGELESASQCYDEALKLDENFANALAGKGSCLIAGPERSNPETISKAAEYFLKAYQADPSFVEAKQGYEQAMSLLTK